MNPWPLIGLLLLVYGIYLWFSHGRWSTNGKHFKLYKVLVDRTKAPDFSITVLKGDLPQNTMPGLVTYVLPRIAAKRGLKPHQIVGCLKDSRAAWNPENFSGNKAFKESIHSIATREIPESVRARAKRLGNGEIRLIDDRVAAQSAEAGDEHCIGFYKVENGTIVAYAPNPSFQLFSSQGPLQLVEPIRSALYAEIASNSHQGVPAGTAGAAL